MAEQPTGGLLNKEAAPEPPPDLVPVRALPCAGRTAPSGTPETNAPGRGHGGQAGSPSLCVRGGRRGVSRALQGLPRKDGGAPSTRPDSVLPGSERHGSALGPEPRARLPSRECTCATVPTPRAPFPASPHDH